MWSIEIVPRHQHSLQGGVSEQAQRPLREAVSELRRCQPLQKPFRECIIISVTAQSCPTFWGRGVQQGVAFDNGDADMNLETARE